MTRRWLLPTMTLVAVFGAFSLVFGQAAPGTDELENAKYQFLGQINANAVMLRSGPGDNDYPTLKLDKGAPLTIVGMKFNWLKVQPPEGSFSYVSKLYIDRHGDGSAGRVTKDSLSVWAGSKLSPVKSSLQTRLSKGTDVSIIGEADEYYMIKPPADAFVWVRQDMVTPVKNLTVAPPPANNNTGGPSVTQTPGAVAVVPSTNPTTVPAIAGVPTTQISDLVAAAEANFEKAETDLKDSAAKPLEEQPITEILTAYEKVLADDATPPSMRRIAESRVATLKQRADAKEKLVAVRKAQQEAAERLKSLRAEREELETRIAQQGVAIYSALGTMQASSLQVGSGGVLYRLTDPANGRTVCYIRTSDPKHAQLLGQFVGVRGQGSDDPQINLKVIAPTELTAVDIAKVNKGVTAAIMPTSLMQKPVQASADTNP